jgi:hypothetical protein
LNALPSWTSQRKLYHLLACLFVCLLAQVEEWNQEIESALVKRARLDSDRTRFSPDYDDSMLQEGLGIEQEQDGDGGEAGGVEDGDVTRLVDTEILPPPSSLPAIAREGHGKKDHDGGGNDRTVVLGYRQVNPNLFPCKSLVIIAVVNVTFPQPILRQPSCYSGQVDSPLNRSICDEGDLSPQLLGRATAAQNRFYSPQYTLEPVHHCFSTGQVAGCMF